MSLKILEIDDKELPIDVLDVEIPELNEMEDMELPDGFESEELKDHTEAISNLTSISLNLAMEGIDQATARSLDTYIPGFYQRSGGGRTFTGQRSIEGLNVAMEAIAGEQKSAIARFMEWLKARVTSIVDWLQGLVARFKKRDEDMNAVNDFLAQQRNDRAFDLLEQKNLSAEEAAKKLLATLGITGDNLDEIRAGLTQHMERVKKNVDQLRNPENKTYVYDLVLTDSIINSHGAISDIREKLDNIMDHCVEAVKAMAVGETMSNGQMEQLEGLVKSFNQHNAVFLSIAENARPSVRPESLTLSGIKRNVGNVSQMFGSSSATHIVESLQRVKELHKLMLSRDEKAYEFKTSENISAKPVAEALTALAKVVATINQINSAATTISGRLVQAMNSFINGLMYVHGQAADDQKEAVTKFCRVNSINVAFK